MPRQVMVIRQGNGTWEYPNRVAQIDLPGNFDPNQPVSVNVEYVLSESEIPETGSISRDNMYEVLRQFWYLGKKIEAIKFLRLYMGTNERGVSNLGLKEAKEFVEYLAESRKWTVKPM